MIAKFAISWLLGALALLAAACVNNATPAPPTNTAVAAVTAVATATSTPKATALVLPTSTATPVPPTPTAVPPEPTAESQPTIPPADLDYEGVWLTYQGILPYNRAFTERIAARPRTPAVGIDRGNPDYLRFSFGDTPPSTEVLEPRSPQILIYPIDEYLALFPEADTAVARLKQLTATQPPLTDKTELPFLPLVAAKEVFHAQPAYVDFQNGRGLRYIAQYEQVPGPITNESIFYTYQGITADEAYYVIAFFPISAAGLPVSYDAADLTVFESDQRLATYYAETTAALMALPADAFEPHLTAIDMVIESLRAEPMNLSEIPTGVMVQGAATSPPAGNLGRISGKISFPNGGIPLMRIYAQSSQGNEFYFTETFENSYTIDVPPGDYFVFAYTLGNLTPGGHTERVRCLAQNSTAACLDQTLAPVTVAAGATADHIDLADWEIPSTADFPPPPDGLMGGVDTAATNTITGRIDYTLSESTPPLRIYAQTLNGDAFHVLATTANASTFSLNVPDGTYLIYAYTSDGTAAGSYSTSDHTLRRVTVGSGETAANIDLVNWSSPPQPPVPPQPERAATDASESDATAANIQPGRGIIRGRLAPPNPSEGVPPVTIYLEEVNSGQLYTIELEAGYTSYFAEVTTGEYIITARTETGATGGYTAAALCDLPAECDDHTPIVVTLSQNGAVVDAADITDWNVPASAVP